MCNSRVSLRFRSPWALTSCLLVPLSLVALTAEGLLAQPAGIAPPIGSPLDMTNELLPPPVIRTTRIAKVDVDRLAQMVLPDGAVLSHVVRGADWTMGVRYYYSLPAPEGQYRGGFIDLAECATSTAARAAILAAHNNAALLTYRFDHAFPADAGIQRGGHIIIQTSNVAIGITCAGVSGAELRAVGEKIAAELESGDTFATREPIPLSAAATHLQQQLRAEANRAPGPVITAVNSAGLAGLILPAEAKAGVYKTAGPDWVMDNRLTYQVPVEHAWPVTITVETKVAEEEAGAIKALLRLWDAEATKPEIGTGVGQSGYVTDGRLVFREGNAVVAITWPRKPAAELKAVGTALASELAAGDRFVTRAAAGE